jgi:HlyD family secretion protein
MGQTEKKFSRFFWSLALILVSGGVYLYGIPFPESLLDELPQESQPEIFPEVLPVSLSRESVSALGRLEPRGEVIEIGVAEKDRIDRLLVKEGQKVKKGEKLAYLERHSERSAVIERLSAKLDEARAQYNAETQFGENQIRENEVRLKRLEEILPMKISSQEAEVRKLEAELNNAKLEFDRLEKLKAQKTISQQTLDRKSLEVTTVLEQLTSAKTFLEELKKSLVLDVELARTELETSRVELIKSQAIIIIDSLEKELEVARAQLEQSIILAPKSGEILEVLAWEGETVDDKPILKLGNTDQMVAVAEVYETDIRWVRKGQKAEIKSPALAQPVSGVVEQVGRLVAKNDVLDVDPASDTDARVVEVKILLDKNDLLTGLTNLQVDVEIFLEK